MPHAGNRSVRFAQSPSTSYFDFYTCRTWDLHNWIGTGPYNDNQTPGTVSYFYGQSGQVLWPLRAPSSGNADWDPYWSLKVC